VILGVSSVTPIPHELLGSLILPPYRENVLELLMELIKYLL
jgi:hypothetical protein